MKRRQPTVHEHFIAGTTAGVVSAALLYPIDLIKVRYQVHETGLAYQSLTQAFRTIYRLEGIKGLYNGLTPATIASAMSWGGYFYFYEHAKKRKLNAMHADADCNENRLGTSQHLLSGIEAGVIMVFFTNPIWLLKTRLQLQGSQKIANVKQYNGPVDAIKTIFKEEGVMGFYKGTVPALLLTSHGAVQFAAYEWMKKIFQSYMNKWDAVVNTKEHKQPAYVSMVIGGTAKIVAATVTYPYQVVKSRLQQRSEITVLSTGSRVEVPKYTGSVDCIRSILRNEGLRGFFKGLIPNCLKVAPNAALTFLVYEESLKLLMELDKH